MEFKPTAAEIANIWEFIISNQAQLCMLEHWDFHAQDQDLKNLLKQSKDTANKIVKNGLKLYKKAGFPEPIGFSQKKDVIPDAPRLMSDKAVLVMLQILAEYGVYGYGLALGKVITPEIIDYFQMCLTDSTNLYKTNVNINEKKGYKSVPVYVPIPKKAEMVKHPSFIAGWLGEQRPLNALEVDSLLLSLRGVMLAKFFYIILAQIANDRDLRKFCQKSKQLCAKRVDRIQSLNSKENLPYQPTYESEITDSTISPYSDKLIMFQAMLFYQIAVARYGNALSSVVRRDISAMFAKYILETGLISDEGLKLSIEKGWFEQPPLVVDRDNLKPSN